MLKTLIKAITPPVILQLRSRLRGFQGPRFFWRGVYSSFGEVPRKGPGFSGEAWVKAWRSRVEAVIPSARSATQTPEDSLIYSLANYQLPLVAALSQNGRRKLRILDFGGGMGVGYLAMIKCLPEGTDFDFHIVEDAETCSACAGMFRDFPNLHFHPGLPANLNDLDIVHLSSALQYIEDYRGLLRSLAGLRPRYVFLVSLQAGQNPTFASAQLNFEDKSEVACWFFNLDEIIQFMSSIGYELMYKSTTDRKYDMSNFDESHRVSRYSNLLFTQKATTPQNV